MRRLLKDAGFMLIAVVGLHSGTLVSSQSELVAQAPSPLPLSPGGRGQGEGAIFQNDTVFGVVLGVHVSLIPTFKTGESLHDRVIRIRNRRSENAGSVA